MADENRNTQTVVELGHESDPSLRETQLVGEVQYEVTSATGFVNKTQLVTEVQYDTPTPVKMTQLCIELWHTPLPAAQRMYVSVI